MTNVRGLDTPCGTCQRRSGDHTFDEWAACLGTLAVDLPYESVPGGPIPLSVDGAKMMLADHLTVRSAVVVSPGQGEIAMLVPAVIFTFGVGDPAGPPNDVAEIAQVGTPETMRKLGRIIHDACNGAANTAEDGA